VHLDFEDTALFRIELMSRGDYRTKDSLLAVSYIGKDDIPKSVTLAPKEIREFHTTVKETAIGMQRPFRVSYFAFARLLSAQYSIRRPVEIVWAR